MTRPLEASIGKKITYIITCGYFFYVFHLLLPVVRQVSMDILIWRLRTNKQSLGFQDQYFLRTIFRVNTFSILLKTKKKIVLFQERGK